MKVDIVEFYSFVNKNLVLFIKFVINFREISDDQIKIVKNVINQYYITKDKFELNQKITLEKTVNDIMMSGKNGVEIFFQR